MDSATLHPLKIDIVQILKVHHSQKQSFPMKLLYNILCAFGECVDE